MVFHCYNCTCSGCCCEVEKNVLAIVCLKTKYHELLHILLLFKKRSKQICAKKSALSENHSLTKFRCGRIMKLRQKKKKIAEIIGTTLEGVYLFWLIF